jgi:Ca-activated chloride channel family protein
MLYFDRPGILLLLWILPLVAGLMIYARRKRAAAARRFIDATMLARLTPPLLRARPWIKGTLALLGLAAIIVACARPRFGVYFEKVVQRGVDCFICLDVSRSMLAEDVAPNRLVRAKSDIRDLLKKLAGDHVGLIVFAGKPVIKVPLTTYDAFFRTVLDDVDAQSAPRGGTLIGDAVRKAMEAMPPKADHDQIIVLLTDGEDQESYALEAAKQAAEKGIKIFAVGLGDSAEGARIPLRGESGGLTYVKEDDKTEHWSKTNQDLLNQIATATGGANIQAGAKVYDLGQVYEDHLANLARGEEENQKRKRFREQYQIFLGLGMALLALERVIPIYGRPNGKRSKEQ